jgi:Effector-associated domain 1
LPTRVKVAQQKEPEVGDTPLLNAKRFPASRPDARRLYDILVSAYSDPARIQWLIVQAGIDTADLDLTGSPKIVWTRVLDLAARSKLLEALVKEAAADKDSSTYHEDLRSFLEVTDGGSLSGEDDAWRQRLARTLEAAPRSRAPILIAL